MPSIRIDRFGGMKPKNKRGQGDVSLASFAQNTNLEHGSVRPWRYPSLELETDADQVCTIHKEECGWLTSDNPCASFTRGDTDCKRIFSTGVVDYPAYAILPDGDGCCEVESEVTWCRLGIPQPTNAPELMGSDPIRLPVDMPVVSTGNYDCTVKGNYKACDYLGNLPDENGDPGVPTPLDEYCDLHGFPDADPWSSDAGRQHYREPRAYTYTFINQFGEESSPSTPSEIWDVDIDGNTVLGFNVPPMVDGYCDPVYIRIYRGLPANVVADGSNGRTSSITENLDAADFDASVSSAFFYVADIPYQEGNFQYNDSIAPDCLGEACVSEENIPPLACLENIQMIENGSLVASYGKELWFTEPYRFNAWNCAMNFDDCIINFKVARSFIYIATDGFPYIVKSETLEDGDCLCCRAVNKLLEPAPIVSGCSMVTTNSGVIWATNTGLVRLVGNEMKVITHDSMSESDWQEYLPHQIKAEYYKGKYFGFNRDKGFIFDLTDGVYSDAYLGENAKFTELNITPDAVYRSDNNILYMSFDGDIFRWDAANTHMPFTWRSKLHVEGGLRNYSIMKIVFEDWLRTRTSPTDTTVRFYADDKLMFERAVSCSRPFRLPKGFDAINFNIEVSGTEPIGEIHLATSKMELIALNNS